MTPTPTLFKRRFFERTFQVASTPDPAVNTHFWHLKHYLNDHPDCHLEVGFDEGLAHLIYAGADMLVMPSLFEPCGLSQMIALKYGTVPIVRAIGGLVDTVFDRDYSDRPPSNATGTCFTKTIITRCSRPSHARWDCGMTSLESFGS